MAMAEPATVTLRVYVREMIVRRDHDPGPGRGEFDVSFVGAASPSSAAPAARSGVRWIASVRAGETTEVGRWTGPVQVRTEHSLAVAGAGEERDRFRAATLFGGLTILGGSEGWGVGRWWRTTNGRDFDYVFYVARLEEGDDPDSTAEPTWTSASEDAPGPPSPSENEYAVVLGAPVIND